MKNIAYSNIAMSDKMYKNIIGQHVDYLRAYTFVSQDYFYYLYRECINAAVSSDLSDPSTSGDWSLMIGSLRYSCTSHWQSIIMMVDSIYSDKIVTICRVKASPAKNKDELRITIDYYGKWIIASLGDSSILEWVQSIFAMSNEWHPTIIDHNFDCLGYFLPYDRKKIKISAKANTTVYSDSYGNVQTQYFGHPSVSTISYRLYDKSKEMTTKWSRDIYYPDYPQHTQITRFEVRLNDKYFQSDLFFSVSDLISYITIDWYAPPERRKINKKSQNKWQLKFYRDKLKREDSITEQREAYSMILQSPPNWYNNEPIQH